MVGWDQHLSASNVPFELLALVVVAPVEELRRDAALLIYLADDPVVYSVKHPWNTCTG